MIYKCSNIIPTITHCGKKNLYGSPMVAVLHQNEGKTVGKVIFSAIVGRGCRIFCNLHPYYRFLHYTFLFSDYDYEIF